MKLYKKFLAICGFMFVAAQVYAQATNTSPYKKMLNIPYSAAGKENVLDAYLPNSYQNAEVIVYLHGSGWTGGDKDELPAILIEQLVTKHNYIVVSANYRLIKDGKNRFPAQMEDVAALFSFLSANAAKYHYNPDKITLMGGSAGAHLAMLYAYGYDQKKQVKTVVDFWGPTDLTDKEMRASNPVANAKIVNLLGVSDLDAKIGFEASPYYKLTKNTGVPTILFHGGKDPLVDISQAEKLYKKLQQLGIPAQYEFYPNEQHGMKGAAAMDVLVKTLAWLKKYRQPVVSVPKSKNGFVVIAHRGSHLVKPENTLAAIEDAIRLGADYVELDLRTTKDGHLILNHNETVDAKSDGKGLVKDLNWSEISALNLKGKDGKTYHIPEFAEALKLCKGKINIYLDFKDANVEETYKQIKLAGIEKSILVYLNKASQYAEWRGVAPEMPLMSSLPDAIKTSADLLEFCKNMQLQAVDNVAEPLLLAALEENGISVFLDAQSKDENPDTWLPLVNKGVQGLQTDHPEALIKFLEQHKLRN